jgi:hypothetical protein
MPKLEKQIKSKNLHRALTTLGAVPDAIEQMEHLMRKSPYFEAALVALNDYDWVLREGIRGLAFTEKALPPLMEAVRDKPFAHTDLLVYLEDDLREVLGDPDLREDFEFSEDEADALVQQLRSLSAVQQLALSRTLQAANRLRAEKQTSAADACREFGVTVI